MSEITTILKDTIKKALLEVYNIDYSIENIIIETPKEKTHGDFSSNIAMKLARELHNSPINIAKGLLENLKGNNLFNNVEIAGPGFINFFIKEESFTTFIKDIILKGDEYGKSNFGNNEKVMVEYVSANPTGDLHLGHARGAAFGDSLTRVLKFAGYDCLREYYVNDAGHQIDVLALSLFNRYKEALGLEINLDEIGYQGKDVINLGKEIALKEKDKYLKISHEEAIEYFKNIGIELELAKIKKDLDLFRVHFDHFSSERLLYKENKVKNTLEKLKSSNYTYEQEGALWLKTTEFGDDKDRVLVKSDGSYTYLLPDIAYHKDKFDRGYNNLINLFGADHHGYILLDLKQVYQF